MNLPKRIIRMVVTTTDDKYKAVFTGKDRGQNLDRKARELTPKERRALIDAWGSFETGYYDQAKATLETAGFSVDSTV